MGTVRESEPNGSPLIRAAIAGIAYLLALIVSDQFVGGAAHEAHVWIASGIAIGVLSVAAPDRWPFYAVAILVAAIVGSLLAARR